MKTTKKMVVRSSGGKMRFIYDDALVPLMAGRKFTVQRASDVEPSNHGWFADMARVGGPVLGPFNLRQDALDAETKWLLDHNIPIPGESDASA